MTCSKLSKPRSKRDLRYPKDKHGRYRRKCLLNRRCPHCGKPCAPYSECEERRAYKRTRNEIKIWVKIGALSKLGHGKYHINSLVPIIERIFKKSHLTYGLNDSQSDKSL